MNHSSSQHKYVKREKKRERKWKQTGLVIARWIETCWDGGDPRKAASDLRYRSFLKGICGQ